MSLSRGLTARDPHQLRHHYIRLYNAKPSPQIAQTLTKNNKNRTRRRPNSSEDRFNQRYHEGAFTRSRGHSGRTSEADEIRRREELRPRRLSSSTFEQQFHHFDESRGIPGNHQRRPNSRDTFQADTFERELSKMTAATDISSVYNMSNKIDRFLNVVERCELELQEEYERRKRRLEEKRQPPWYRSNQSLSSHNTTTNNNKQQQNNNNNYKQRNRSTGSRSPLSSTTRAYSAVIPRNKPPLIASKSKQQQQPVIKKFQKKQHSIQSSSSSKNQITSTHNRPLKAYSNLSVSSSRKTIKEFPIPDTTRVKSKLKQDQRNYQPPRRRKTTPTRTKKKTKQSTEKAHDYEDDFEAEDEEEEDDDEEEEEAEMTKQWLNDQAKRGAARQRGSIYSNNHFDKESSKDSAYGYSGGESRLATREPTPDTFMQLQAFMNKTRDLRMRKSTQKLTASSSRDHLDSEDEKSSCYVGFVNKVTEDILKRGIFTDKALKETLDKNMKAKCPKGISPKELSNLTAKLRKELGIQSPNNQLNSSLSEMNLTDLLNRRNHPRAQKKVQLRKSTSNLHSNNESESEYLMSDRELTEILQRELDLDAKTLEEVMGESVQPVNRNLLDCALFDSLNISNLNISFNEKKQQKEQREKQRASLVKSFGNNAKEPRRRATRPKSAKTNNNRQDSSSSNPDNNNYNNNNNNSSETPRSSSLYQPEETEEDLKHDESEISDDDDPHNDNNDNEINDDIINDEINDENIAEECDEEEEEIQSE